MLIPTLFLTLTGCATRHSVPEADPVERYRVRISADFSTTGQDALPPQAAALLEPIGLDLDAVLTIEHARRFRDGSDGKLVRFVSAEGTLRREGAEPVDAALSLAGRSVEMRTFSDGELLDVDLLQYAAGPGRYGDIFDLIYPILTPTPPTMSGREVTPRAMHWPVRLTRTDTLLNTLWASWEVLERDGQSWHLGYDGKWSIRGSQLAGGRKVPAGGEGSGSGEIWMSEGGDRMERHTFLWQRTLTLIYAPREDAVLRLHQTQRFSGEVERL